MLTFLKRKYRNLTGDKGFPEILTGTAWSPADRPESRRYWLVLPDSGRQASRPAVRRQVSRGGIPIPPALRRW